MPKRFCLLLEDDFELMGNGLGNVAQMQYLPSLFLMKTLKRLGGNMTFMVDVVNQLRYYEPDITDRNLIVQRKLWEENILLMKEYGFDVQLHLHPQWFRAKKIGDHFLLSNVWNIGRYNPEEQSVIINNGINYLENLVRQVDPAYKVIAFKGGSWGLQPSQNLFKVLGENGIRIVMGVRNDLKIPKSGTDYSNTEERIMPYFPDYADIRKVSTSKEQIVIIPQPEYSPKLLPMFFLGWDMFKQKLFRKDHTRYYYGDPAPNEIFKMSPLLDEEKLNLSLNPYKTHLKIGNQPYHYLKASFDSVIERLKDSPYDRIPVVMESHTKNYFLQYKAIERFLEYIMTRYGDIVEFGTLTGFYKELQAKPELIHSKADSGIPIDKRNPG
jgi:hypothetical protein